MTAAGLPREHAHREYNIQFLCTSNAAPPLEMLEGIVEEFVYVTIFLSFHKWFNCLYQDTCRVRYQSIWLCVQGGSPCHTFCAWSARWQSYAKRVCMSCRFAIKAFLPLLFSEGKGWDWSSRRRTFIKECRRFSSDGFPYQEFHESKYHDILICGYNLLMFRSTHYGLRRTHKKHCRQWWWMLHLRHPWVPTRHFKPWLGSRIHFCNSSLPR